MRNERFSPRIKGGSCLTKKYDCQCKDQKGDHQRNQEVIPLCETVKGKCGSSAATVSAAAHGISGNDTTFQSPGCEGGKDSHTVIYLFHVCAVFIAALADGFSGPDDLFAFIDQVGNHSQDHHQK